MEMPWHSGSPIQRVASQQDLVSSTALDQPHSWAGPIQ
jgi:hypothetical protein